VIRPNGNITSEWVWYYLRQRRIRDEVKRYFTGSVGQQRVPKEFLEMLELPLSPFEEQKRIVAQLDRIREGTNNLKKLLEEIERDIGKLRETILHKAFRGELRLNMH